MVPQRIEEIAPLAIDRLSTIDSRLASDAATLATQRDGATLLDRLRRTTDRLRNELLDERKGNDR